MIAAKSAQAPPITDLRGEMRGRVCVQPLHLCVKPARSGLLDEHQHVAQGRDLRPIGPQQTHPNAVTERTFERPVSRAAIPRNPMMNHSLWHEPRRHTSSDQPALHLAFLADAARDGSGAELLVERADSLQVATVGGPIEAEKKWLRPTEAGSSGVQPRAESGRNFTSH